MIKTATWNVRGLNKEGKLQIQEGTVEDIASAGVAETH